MKTTLKQISAMCPGSYRVYDRAVTRADIKTWSDTIEIIVNRKSKFCTRKGAYKYGLAEGV